VIFNDLRQYLATLTELGQLKTIDGASCELEIGAITGHTSLAELVRYTKAADQRRLAEAAMAKTGTSARKPSREFAKNAENAGSESTTSFARNHGVAFGTQSHREGKGRVHF